MFSENVECLKTVVSSNASNAVIAGALRCLGIPPRGEAARRGGIDRAHDATEPGPVQSTLRTRGKRARDRDCLEFGTGIWCKFTTDNKDTYTEINLTSFRSAI